MAMSGSLQKSLLLVLLMTALVPAGGEAVDCNAFCSRRFSVCIYVRQCVGGVVPSMFFLCPLRCYDIMTECKNRCMLITQHGPLRKY